MNAKSDHTIVPMEHSGLRDVASPSDVHMDEPGQSETSFDQRLQSKNKEELNGESEEKKTAVKICKSGDYDFLIYAGMRFFRFLPNFRYFANGKIPEMR